MRITAILSDRRFPVVAAVLGSLLLLPAVQGGFQLDDHFQRLRLLGLDRPSIQLFVFYDGDPDNVRALVDRGLLPWWSAETLRHASLRYLSVMTMQFDYLLWPERPALMHVHSLLWLSLLIVAVGALYRRLAPAGWVAGLAVLLYALDDAHALPAAYLANRNALVATAFGAIALLCYSRAREDGWPPGRVLGPVSLALGMAAGEMALAAAGYLAAYAWLIDRAPLRERVRSLVPYGAVLVLWAVAYKLGGFGAEGSGNYIEPLRDPAAFLAAFGERAPLLLLGQWTPFPADLLFTLGQDQQVLRIGALVTLAVLAALLLPLVLRDRVAGFWATGMLLSLFPIAAAGPQNRLLFFVGIGAMALLAHLVHALVSRSGSIWWRVPAWGAAGLLLAVHLLLSPLLALQWLGIQAQSNTKMVRALESVPRDAAIAEQDLIFVNPPGYTYVVSGVEAFQRVRGRPFPRRVRALSAGTSALEVERIDARTLEVRFPRGLFPTVFSRYYRSRELPFQVGDVVDIERLRAEIVRLDADGDPDVVRYRFDVPLEDASLRWLSWGEGRFKAWTPPPAGTPIHFPESRGIFEYDPDWADVEP